MINKMNLTDKLYQEFVIDAISQTEWDSPNNSPLVIELDPTAACNLACPGCISEDIIAKGGRFSNERLLSLGKEFIDIGVKAVILIGGGEPLAHPRAGMLIELLGSNDVHVGITTNGSFIDRSIVQIAKYVQWTRVSMDAGSKQTFSKLRPNKNGKSDFSKIINNMEQLAKIKKGKLGFSFLIQTESDGLGVVSNISEIYSAAKLSKEIGCDYFEVKPSYNFRGDVPHSLMKHKQKDMDHARIEIERLNELQTSDFRILQAINLERSLQGVNILQEKKYKSCPSTHLRTTVTPTGVFVCPYWRGKEHMRIGDVTENSFHETWQGVRRGKIMNRLDVSKECQFDCLRHETNLLAIDLKKRLNDGSGIKVIEEFDRFL